MCASVPSNTAGSINVLKAGRNLIRISIRDRNRPVNVAANHFEYASQAKRPIASEILVTPLLADLVCVDLATLLGLPAVPLANHNRQAIRTLHEIRLA